MRKVTAMPKAVLNLGSAKKINGLLALILPWPPLLTPAVMITSPQSHYTKQCLHLPLYKQL